MSDEPHIRALTVETPGGTRPIRMVNGDRDLAERPPPRARLRHVGAARRGRPYATFDGASWYWCATRRAANYSGVMPVSPELPMRSWRLSSMRWWAVKGGVVMFSRRRADTGTYPLTHGIRYAV
jgi:hypothetical protein